jgi:hypothetical protein
LRTVVLLGVWVYMMLAVLTEVGIFYELSGLALVVTSITILAASQAVAVVLFYMHLKDEPGSLRLFALIPLMFLSALLIAMIAALG